ncbi:MAG: hypothetical protein ACWA5X_02790 [bacterium]
MSERHELATSELTPDEIELLSRARNGARSLAWLLMFSVLCGGMMWMMSSSFSGLASILGTFAVVVLTAWVIMLFVSCLSHWAADLLLRIFSPRHRKLQAMERDDKATS